MLLFNKKHQEIFTYKRYSNLLPTTIKNAILMMGVLSEQVAYSLIVPVKKDGTHHWKDFVQVIFREGLTESTKARLSRQILKREMAE